MPYDPATARQELANHLTAFYAGKVEQAELWDGLEAFKAWSRAHGDYDAVGMATSLQLHLVDRPGPTLSVPSAGVNVADSRPLPANVGSVGPAHVVQEPK